MDASATVRYKVDEVQEEQIHWTMQLKRMENYHSSKHKAEHILVNFPTENSMDKLHFLLELGQSSATWPVFAHLEHTCK